ncbi:hypothetical protein ABBQ32_005407 [Trebouxia sp. C0010 RCD-2024]
MASFANSFALLEGDAPTASPGNSKKKKSKKSKRPPVSAVPPSGLRDPATTAAPRSAVDTPTDDGFQVAGKVSRRNSTSKASSPDRKKRSLMEGIADVETASGQAHFTDNIARVAQWNSWRQQMLLISEALEISAQRCLEAPLPTAADLDEYGDLLVACLPANVREEQVQALLSSIHHLGKIVTALHAKKGIKAQAQQAIVAAVACLKEPQMQPETTSSAPSVNSEVLDLAANQAHELEDIAKRIGEPSSWRGNKDAIQRALKLSMEHLDLFSDRGAQAPNSKAARAVAALDALLQDLGGSEEGSEPSPSRDNGTPPEDTMHLQQLQDIRIKIRECEAVLEVLRQQEQDYLARVPSSQRHKIKQRQANGFEAHATPEQIESLDTLKEYMISSKGPFRDPSGLSASGMSEGQLSEAVQYFLANLERMLHFNRRTIEEACDKVKEVAVKLASAIKTGRTLQMLEGMKQEDLAKNRMHQHNYEKQLKALIGSIEGTMRESRQSLKGMDTYKAQLHRIWPTEDVQHWWTSFNECMLQAQTARDAALDLACHNGQAPSQRAAAAVSLSHADPVVQPTQSSAGAVGTSANPT